MKEKDIWDSVAKSYQDESTGLWQSESIAIKEIFEDRNETVLIVGGGCGRVSFMMSKLGFNVVSTDLSPIMIKIANQERKYYSSIVNKKIKFLELDILDVSNVNDRFKYIFFPFHGIDHIYPRENRLKAFQNISLLLKDNESKAIVVSRNLWDYIFSKKFNLLKTRIVKYLKNDEAYFYNTAYGLQKYLVYSNFGNNEKRWIETNTDLTCLVKRRNSFAYFPTVKTSSYFYILKKKSF